VKTSTGRLLKAFQSLLTVFFIMLVLTSPAFALNGDLGSSVQTSATVEKYASVTTTGSMDIGSFTGIQNEVSPDTFPYVADSAIFTVETNAPVVLTFSGSDLMEDAEGGASTIMVSYSAHIGTTAIGYFTRNLELNYTEAVDATAIQVGCTEETYHIYGQAKLGSSISSQPAGSYSAAITLTVSEE